MRIRKISHLEKTDIFQAKGIVSELHGNLGAYNAFQEKQPLGGVVEGGAHTELHSESHRKGT